MLGIYAAPTGILMCPLSTMGAQCPWRHLVEYVPEKCGSCPNSVQYGETTNWGSGDLGQYLLCDMAVPYPSVSLNFLTRSVGVTP